MRDQIRVLGWCFIIYGLFFVAIGVLIFMIVFGAGIISGDRIAMYVTGTIGTLIASALIIFWIPNIIAGIGLISFRSWGRVLALVVGALHILAFPIGTAVGIFAFFVLMQPDAEALFDGRVSS
jgi:hypothetical protein